MRSYTLFKYSTATTKKFFLVDSFSAYPFTTHIQGTAYVDQLVQQCLVRSFVSMVIMEKNNMNMHENFQATFNWLQGFEW